MAEKPEPPKPISWNVHKSKAVWLGEVEAIDEAIENTAAEFKVPAAKLMAIRR